MKIGAALAVDLSILTAALDEPGADVLHSLRQLGVDAHAAVPTYLGLSVTVDGSDPPFTLTTVEDGAADGVRTFDLGGESSTTEVVDEVLERLARRST